VVGIGEELTAVQRLRVDDETIVGLGDVAAEVVELRAQR